MSDEKPKYIEPVKQILNAVDMAKWQKSEAYHEYTGFVLAMNEAVKGKKIVDIDNISDTVERLCDMLSKMSSWIDEIPPIDQPQRFGNKAFRDWLQKLKAEAENMIKEILPEEHYPSVIELSVYLVESVGNITRIDYGTGHEMSFAMFLCCFFKIGVLKKEDSAAVVLKVFEKYLCLMRKLQITYRMEPAGSHGVWSLDDYQFLPFIWGSSQLIGHNRLEPQSMTNADIAEKYSSDYIFMGCIKFINEVKTGPFSEHSNQLWNISGVHTWTKVNSGLIKMYKVEVLGKFPVIQHTFFGTLFPMKPHDPNRESVISLN